MSVLDDFFGSSETAVKECLYCGGTEGELIVAISDNNGPTHWKHPGCSRDFSKERTQQTRVNSTDEMEDQ